MGWIEDLRGQIVGVDFAPVIYYIEEHAIYGYVLDVFFEAVGNGEFNLITSAVTVLEVLVQPIRKNDDALASKYNDILLSSTNIVVMPVTPMTAQTAAELRAASKLKTPDAIQLATAMNHGATTFITNDRDFGSNDRINVIKLRDLIA